MSETAVRLGSSADALKSGRYVRLMGTLWRHRKTEQCGDAALGLLMRILSFSADQAVTVISERRMRDLFRGSPHGRRNLNELIKAGFMEACADGYRIHDWDEHNRPKKPKLALVQGGQTEPARGRGKVDLRRTSGEVTGSAPPVTIEEVAVSRAYALTQDPREEERSEAPTGPRVAPAEPPPAPPVERPGPRKARPRKPPDERIAVLRRELARASREQRLVPTSLGSGHEREAVKRAQGMADLEGVDFATAAGRLADGACEMVQRRGKALCWALRDWQPGQASGGGGSGLPDPFSARPGRMARAPARGPEYFGDAETFERQLAVIRGVS